MHHIHSPRKKVDHHHRLESRSAEARALFALELMAGAARPTAAQAAAAVRMSVSYVNTARRATVLQRHDLAHGRLKLSALHHRRRPVTDADVERIVIGIGPDRIMSVLDKITAPMREVRP